MPMLDLISAYENYLTKVKQASNNTITSYMRDIRQFAGWLSTTEELDTVDATQENISRYMEVLEEEGRSTATQARCVASGISIPIWCLPASWSKAPLRT